MLYPNLSKINNNLLDVFKEEKFCYKMVWRISRWKLNFTQVKNRLFRI